MNKTKKVLAILLAIILLANVAPVFAQARYGGKRTSATNDTALLLPAGTWVYGISIYASSANANAGIFDAATLSSLGSSVSPVDEIGEATQYDHADRPWPKPIYFTNGVTVIVNDGTFFVDYGPEP